MRAIDSSVCMSRVCCTKNAVVVCKVTLVVVAVFVDLFRISQQQKQQL